MESYGLVATSVVFRVRSIEGEDGLVCQIVDDAGLAWVVWIWQPDVRVSGCHVPGRIWRMMWLSARQGRV
jgi:hypothetical protein